MPVFQKHLLIPMRDGIRLAASVHWPDGARPDRTRRTSNRYPAVIEYHPYRKDDRSAPRAADHDYFARNGFVSIRLDVRGTGSSEGVNTDEYMPVETRDGYDAIEWIAAQPWSNGKVGMFGSSYGGFTCLQVATLRPPHLAAIAPIYATDDRYTDDCHYKGGAFKAYYDVGTYGTMMIALNALPPDPDACEDWERRWQERLERNEPYMQTWLAHQCDGPYWRPGSLRGQYRRVRAATFMIGGWQDGYPNPLFRTFENLKCPKRLLVGPWNHSRPAVAVPGPRIDYLKEIRRWFDLWLKDVDDGVSNEPPVTFYVQRYDEPDPRRQSTSGEWRAEPTWPIRGAREAAWRLGAGGGLEGVVSARSGAKASAAPITAATASSAAAAAGTTSGATASVDYDPTVGTAGGLWSGGLPFGLAGDQRPDEARSIVFTSDPLRRPLTIAGYPRASLSVSSSAPVAVFVVKLCDVAPDGKSALVARGILNGTRRGGMRSCRRMVPGRRYRIDIPIDATAWRFEPGHRIRVAISGADFPNSWPTPYPAKLTVYLGTVGTAGGHRSTIHLPVIPPARRQPPRFDPPPVATRPSAVSTPDPDVWEFSDDVLRQRTTLHVRRGGRTALPDAAAVYACDELRLTAARTDPATVEAIGTSTSRIEYPGADLIEAVATQTVRSDRDFFHWSVDLQVRHNGRARFSKKWQKSFPRELL